MPSLPSAPSGLACPPLTRNFAIKHDRFIAGETTATIKRIVRGQHLHRVTPILDASGRVIDLGVKPLMVELRVRDVIQVVVGASILAMERITIVGLSPPMSAAVSDALK